ncbi:MAG: twin-arginine translocation signal domain-containing protein, partial [Chloroflexi bacterium]|nr:twin-arginine translocation signal domain-containing protein [Chloroflexota bacterium]
MSEKSLIPRLSRRQFLKTTAVTAVLVAVGDKLFGGPMSTLVESAAAAPAVEDKWIPTACWHCSAACNLLAHRVNGVVVKIEGNPDSSVNRGKVCQRGNATIMRLYNPYQVKTPLKRTNPVRARKNRDTGEWEIPDPGWVEISWEEALDTVAQKLKKIRADNANKFVYMEGWNMRTNITGQFPRAFGTINSISGYGGMQCGAALHFVGYIMQRKSTNYPDADYNMFNIGTKVAGAACLNKASVTDVRTWLERRKEGGRSICVDPIYSTNAMKADEWVPIRPGTGASMACALAMINIIIHELKIYDVDFLKKRSNAPYLIGPDGHYVRAREPLMEDPVYKKIKQGKPLIWDPVDGKAKMWDDKTSKDFALEGTYTVDGVKCQPAFQILKEHVKQYTPEWAAKISDVPAETLRRLARELVEEARIGSTIVIEGHTFPYRPATLCAKTFTARHRQHSVMLHFAGMIVNMLVGNLDVPGGILGSTDLKWNPVDGVVMPYSHTAYRFKWPPDAYQFDTFYPVAYKTWNFFWLQLLDRAKYHCPYEVEALAVMGANTVMAGGSPDINMEAFTKLPFAWGLAYHFDENCEMCDILLPEPGWTGRYMEQNGLRQPLLDKPLYDQRLPEDILTELAVRAGFLEDWNKQINSGLGLKDANALDTKTRYTWEEILDRRLKQQYGREHDLAWFKVHGILETVTPMREKYGYYKYPEAKYAFYWDYIKWRGEQLKRELDAVGVKHPHPEAYDEYQAL